MRISLLRPALERKALGVMGQRWKTNPGGGVRRPSLWGSQIEAFVENRVPVDTVSVCRDDDVQAALDEVIASASDRGGTATPQTHRARLIFAEGI